MFEKSVLANTHNLFSEHKYKKKNSLPLHTPDLLYKIGDQGVKISVYCMHLFLYITETR